MIVAITNGKGGVGKTTVAFNLAAVLAHQGCRVLAVDGDPQASLSDILLPTYSRGEGMGPDVGLSGLLRGAIGPGAAIRTYPEVTVPGATLPAIDVIPANDHLADAADSGPTEARNFVLRERLMEIVDDYDYVVIDVGPTLSQLQISAMMAADTLILPAKCDHAMLYAHRRFVERLTDVLQLNPDLSVLGVVPTFYDQRHLTDRAALRQLHEWHQADDVRVFPPIPATTVFEQLVQVRWPLVGDPRPEQRYIEPFFAMAEALHRLRDGEPVQRAAS